MEFHFPEEPSNLWRVIHLLGMVLGGAIVWNLWSTMAPPSMTSESEGPRKPEGIPTYVLPTPGSTPQAPISGSSESGRTPRPSIDRERATELLIETLVQIESRGDRRAVGSSGERGLMQIMEMTWEETTKKHFGVAWPFDWAFNAEKNRQVGRLHLGDLQEELYRDRERWKADARRLLFAAYNGGVNRLKRADYDVRNLPGSVQSYVERAEALHDAYLEGDAKKLKVLLAQIPGRPDAAPEE